MGAALVQFSNTCARDTTIQNSPYFVGESVICVIPQNHGLNHCACTFTHDVWIMMVNYPQEAWLVEKVRECVSEFGYILVWNRHMSNRASILVKIRVPNMLNIPISLVLSKNTSDKGTGHSWTVVNYILHANLLGINGGDDDPLPPDGGNPHPLPNLPFGGIWEYADFVQDAPPADQHVQAPDVPMVHTPP
jgi:hypothetical protein